MPLFSLYAIGLQGACQCASVLSPTCCSIFPLENHQCSDLYLYYSEAIQVTIYKQCLEKYHNEVMETILHRVFFFQISFSVSFVAKFVFYIIHF